MESGEKVRLRREYASLAPASPEKRAGASTLLAFARACSPAMGDRARGEEDGVSLINSQPLSPFSPLFPCARNARICSRARACSHFDPSMRALARMGKGVRAARFLGTDRERSPLAITTLVSVRRLQQFVACENEMNPNREKLSFTK